MDSIRIETGEITLCINDDPQRVISFSPTDVLFAERFYKTYREINKRMADFKGQAAALDKNTQLDAEGLPANSEEKINLVADACKYVREKVDYLFGEGSSEKIYGSTLDLRLFVQTEQFFAGILPYFEKARKDMVNLYIKKKKATQ